MSAKRTLSSVIGAFFVFFICLSRPAYAAPPDDPCSFLTKDQIGAVLSVPVEAGQRLATTACQWSAQGSNSLGAKKVSLTFQQAQAFAYARMPAGAGVTKTPMSGLGDDAVFGVTGKFAATITVKKGDTVFTVRVIGFPLDPGASLDKVQAMEQTLALQVLAKL